ncbi:MAG: hypothetical protein N2Z21_10150 [Candidatus Sumerlaeaceae bacterium]|nr:hypothetical protein [Candidatus Sumerlaeaceae bacterium]
MRSEKGAALARKVCEYLNSLGTEAHIDSDGDVVFKDGLGTYIATFDDDDPYYFRLVFPNFFQVESANRERVLAAAFEIIRDVKAVKIFIVRDRVNAAVEQYVTNFEQVKEIFERSKNSLEHGAMLFGIKMILSELGDSPFGKLSLDL